MYFENKDQLLHQAWELTVPSDSPFSRFYSSMLSMLEIIGRYMDKMDTPEEEKRRLVGHFGLTGETGNSIGQFLTNIAISFESDPSPSLERTLQQAFFLSTMENHPSQYSHMTHSGENVIAACNRIIDDIGKWTDAHAGEIPPLDRLRILKHRREFSQSFEKIHDFIVGARGYFETHDAGAAIPEKYRRMIQSYRDGETPPSFMQP